MDDSKDDKKGTETDTTVIPKDYLLRSVAQFLLDNQIPLEDVEKAIVVEERNRFASTAQSLASSRASPKEIAEYVRGERWSNALDALLPVLDDSALAFDLFEHLVRSLCAVESFEAARSLLSSAPILAVSLKRDDPERYGALARIAAEGNKREAFQGGIDEQRPARLALATRVEQFLARAAATGSGKPQPLAAPLPPGRLLSFIQDGLKWRAITSGARRRPEWEDEDVNLDDPREQDRKRRAVDVSSGANSVVWTKPHGVASKFGKGVSLHCGALSPDGMSFAVGTSDGFIEIFQVPSMKQRKDLPYQANGEPLLVESPVSCLVFSICSDLLACGDSEGKVYVFRVSNGSTVSRFASGHSKGGVAAICLSPDGTKVATGGVDGICRVFSVANGTRLCECLGHDSFVNTMTFLSQTRLITGSSDEKLKIWNSSTGDLVKTIASPGGKITQAIPISNRVTSAGPACFLSFGEFSHVVVSSPSKVSLVSLDTYAISTLMAAPSSGGDIVASAVSRSGHSVMSLVQHASTKGKESSWAVLTFDRRSGSRPHEHVLPSTVPAGSSSKSTSFFPLTLIVPSPVEEHTVIVVSKSAIASFTT